MTSTVPVHSQSVVSHPFEDISNAVRQRNRSAIPRCQRTYTPSQIVISQSSGCYHFTPEDRQLADFSSGVLVANLGHNPADWWRRVWKYMGLEPANQANGFLSAQPLTSYNAITEIETQASERLIENMQRQPGGTRMQQVLWAASGSEAIIKSIWAALLRADGKQIILATRHGFHGKKGLAGATTGSEKDPERDARVKFIGFPMQECFSWQRRQRETDLTPYRNELETLAQTHNGQIACLVTEPYLGGGGSYHPPTAYLQMLQRFCREHDILLILDEIQSCFGRTGNMFAYSTYGIEPDIVCLGKGLGNGMPVDAAVGRADVFTKLDFGLGSDTWSGHPLGCAAVLATLDEFEEKDVLENVHNLADTLRQGLTKLTRLAAVKAVRGEGAVWGVHCAEIGHRSAAEVANEIVWRSYLGNDKGRAIHLLGPLADCVIRVSPPLVMPPAEVADYLDVLEEIVRKVSAN